MEPFYTKETLLPGTNYKEAMKHARSIFHAIEAKTKRKPYIRSAYFKKEKIFFDFFWTHLKQKRPPDRFQRLQYFAAAIELIEHSRIQPESKANPNKPTERLHRFMGKTREGNVFFVQIKENLRSNRKYFMSCFPWK